MPLETIRRPYSVIRKRILFELEGETVEPERGAFDPFSTYNITIPDPSTPSDPITSSDPSDTPILQNLNSPNEQPEFLIADDHLVLNEHDNSESVKDLRIAEDHLSVILNPRQQSYHPHMKLRSLLEAESKTLKLHLHMNVSILSEIEPKKLIEAL
ncbi:hypothetical protein Tco_1267671 [Tanacetum coccineum]